MARIPSGIKSASSVIGKMKYQPIKQKELARGIRQEGYDNKAVSQSDRILGKQVAKEQGRLLELDEFGQDLAMRKDKLAFAQKLDAEGRRLAEKKFKMDKDAQKYNQTMTVLETGIGAASTGVSIYRDRERRAQAKIYAADWQNYMSRLGVNMTPYLGDNNYDLDFGGTTN